MPDTKEQRVEAAPGLFAPKGIQRRGYLAIVTLVLSAGCGTSNPDPARRAQVTAPVAWSAAAEAPARDTAADVVQNWIRDVGGEPLERLVAQALQHNRDLAVAAARVRQAAAQARLAGADRWPQASAGASANRSKTVTPNPFRSLPAGAPTAVLPDLLAIQTTRFGLSADVSWEADLWGRLADTAQAARATHAAVQSDFEAARLALAGEVARRWLDYTLAAQQLALAEQTEESFRAQERIVTRRFDAGTSSALDVRLARTSTRSAAASVAGLRQQLDALGRALDVLLGRYPDRKLAAATRWPDFPSLPGAGLPAELVRRRPDLAAAEARYAAAAHQRGAARKLRYPRLTLSASAGTASTELGDLLDSDFGVWSLVGGLTAPIFTGGRIRAQIDAAEAGEEAALQEFAAKLLTAFREVETALAADRLLAEREARVAELEHEAARAEAQAWELYQRGLVEIPTVLEAQRRAFDSRSQLLAVRGQRRQNRATLHLALGGGIPASNIPPARSNSP